MWWEVWSFIAILVSAFVIGWGAELSQKFLPRGIALAILAWLQCIPEFAVEAVIAWEQKQDLMIANLTGSLRLLLGFGWPMVFFIYFFSQKLRNGHWVKRIQLEEEDSISIFFLGLTILFFQIIFFKQTLNLFDSVFLIGFYAAYIYFSSRVETHSVESDELPWVCQKVELLSIPWQRVVTLLFFLLGGIALYFSVHPFLNTIERLAIRFGISTFVFVQWVAPFLSEFPEKVSAFNWARQDKKVGLAMMNLVGSNLNQWTVLAAMIPIVYNLSCGELRDIHLIGLSHTELGLTLAQGALGALLLLDLEFSIIDALIILVLWGTQFIFPEVRGAITFAYLFWFILESVRHLNRYFRTRVPPRMVVGLRNTLFRP